VSRVFQEFSLGIVNIASAKKIVIIPFPFPYAQLMQFLLSLQALVVPLMAGYSLHAWWVAGCQTFILILLSWSIHFIAMEIEMPFGDDDNDLPLMELVSNMNESLTTLLHERVQERPSYKQAIPPTGEASVGLNIVKFRFDASDLSPKKFLDDPPRLDDLLQPPEKAGEVVLPPISESQSPPPIALVKQAPTPAEVHAAQNIAVTTPKRAPGTDDAVRQLTALSGQIDGQISQLGQRIEALLHEIVSDVKQLHICAARYLERQDRLEKAAALGRPVSSRDSSNLWFCQDAKAHEIASEADPCSRQEIHF
jgi:hypothetical protein